MKSIIALLMALVICGCAYQPALFKEGEFVTLKLKPDIKLLITDVVRYPNENKYEVIYVDLLGVIQKQYFKEVELKRFEQ